MKNDASSFVISPELVQLHVSLLFDENISPACRALILREGEDINTFPQYAHNYWELAHARTALLQAVYDAASERVLTVYRKLQAENKPGPHMEGLHQRAYKQHLFSILFSHAAKSSVLATRSSKQAPFDISALALELIDSPFMSDQQFGFLQYLNGPASAQEKEDVTERLKKKWATHPDSIEIYVSTISSVDAEDGHKLLRHLVEKDNLFNINLAGHARTAARNWSVQRKRSLLDDAGLQLTIDLFHAIGRVNQYSAQSFISALNDLPKFNGEAQKRLLRAVVKMKDGLDPVKQESLFNQLNTVLSPFKEQLAQL